MILIEYKNKALTWINDLLTIYKATNLNVLLHSS